jgi:hypothetical protein
MCLMSLAIETLSIVLYSIDWDKIHLSIGADPVPALSCSVTECWTVDDQKASNPNKGTSILMANNFCPQSSETGSVKTPLKHFIRVGCILLRYLYMLYKHTTQKLYICDQQTHLNNFFTLPKISLHVSAPTGHLHVIFLKISYSTAIHPSSLQV